MSIFRAVLISVFKRLLNVSVWNMTVNKNIHTPSTSAACLARFRCSGHVRKSTHSLNADTASGKTRLWQADGQINRRCMPGHFATPVWFLYIVRTLLLTLIKAITHTTIKQCVPGTTNLAPRPIAGCCHLANLSAWSQNHWQTTYFYFNPAFGLQLSLIKLSWVLWKFYGDRCNCSVAWLEDAYVT